ncbi:MAG: hypothetical protein IJG16_08465 [Clostridia bacterium]|nr:hypothetical protein [Clostridia bacterium]
MAMTSAINNNDFSLVASYLKLDSNAYNEQKDYILNYCQENQITERLKNIEIVKTTIENKYTVIEDTYETYHLLSPKKGDRDSSFNTKYTIEYTGDKWEISKIINL